MAHRKDPTCAGRQRNRLLLFSGLFIAQQIYRNIPGNAGHSGSKRQDRHQPQQAIGVLLAKIFGKRAANRISKYQKDDAQPDPGGYLQSARELCKRLHPQPQRLHIPRGHSMSAFNSANWLNAALGELFCPLAFQTAGQPAYFAAPFARATPSVIIFLASAASPQRMILTHLPGSRSL